MSWFSCMVTLGGSHFGCPFCVFGPSFLLFLPSSFPFLPSTKAVLGELLDGVSKTYVPHALPCVRVWCACTSVLCVNICACSSQFCSSVCPGERECSLARLRVCLWGIHSVCAGLSQCVRRRARGHSCLCERLSIHSECAASFQCV